jgi:hypothetical protein
VGVRSTLMDPWMDAALSLELVPTLMNLADLSSPTTRQIKINTCSEGLNSSSPSLVSRIDLEALSQTFRNVNRR